MTTIHRPVQCQGHVSRPSSQLDEIVAGLSAEPRTLPCKLFYDRAGSEYFDLICRLPEYYPARTEARILRDHVDEICTCLGPDVVLIEFGSGSSIKTRELLRTMERPAAYLPVDISYDHLYASASALGKRYPELRITPVCADYCRPLHLPVHADDGAKRVVFFPGSTIGNFHPPEARSFIRRLRRLVGPGGGLLIGIDLYKTPEVLLPAYNDQAGITARFNRNILYRVRNEFGADVQPQHFMHEARWNEDARRIEMRLIAKTRERIGLGGRRFHFEPGESVWTESSYKHTIAGFSALCTGLEIKRVWTDRRNWFALLYMTAEQD